MANLLQHHGGGRGPIDVGNDHAGERADAAVGSDGGREDPELGREGGHEDPEAGQDRQCVDAVCLPALLLKNEAIYPSQPPLDLVTCVFSTTLTQKRFQNLSSV